ncbi:hypothetical protein NFHSH190041_35100 [Shewanella sp. NFH-SH190041]|nr:hypothetical protein NFHSH190041_35100 [Shewanella sp. NFH-SH190041]
MQALTQKQLKTLALYVIGNSKVTKFTENRLFAAHIYSKMYAERYFGTQIKTTKNPIYHDDIQAFAAETLVH